MSDLWYKAADGDGYTNDLERADPADVKVKHAALELVLARGYAFDGQHNLWYIPRMANTARTLIRHLDGVAP